MRTTRLKKYKNDHRYFIELAKLLVISYLVIFMITYLTTVTDAYYSSQSQTTVGISSGIWPDGSDLSFIGKGNQNIKTCPIVEISVEIKNNGKKMKEPSKFEVYYTENGNPKQNGEIVFTDEIPVIDEDQKINLTYLANVDGDYAFKAYQTEPYEQDENRVVWSEKIKVNCPNPNSNNQSTNIENYNQGEITDNEIENEANQVLEMDIIGQEEASKIEEKQSILNELDSANEFEVETDNDPNIGDPDNNELEETVDNELETTNEEIENPFNE